MADPSLLDFGQMMNSMVNMGQLREYQRHNDIAEQNSIATMGGLKLKQQEFDLDQQKLALQKQQIQQNGYFRAYDEIQKQKEDPTYNLLPVEQKVNLLDLQGRLLAQSAGVPYDPPDRNELRGAVQERDDLNNAMRLHLSDPSNEGYRVEAYARLAKYVAASPKDGLKLLEGLDKLGSLDDKGRELKLKIEKHQAQLEKLNTQAGAIRMQQGIYTEHLGAINQTASIPLKKEYQPHFQALLAMDRPEAQAAYLNLHPEIKSSFLAEINQRKEAMGFKDSQILKELGVAGEPGVISALNQAIDARRDAVSAAQQATGQASPEAEAELAHLISVRDARLKEADWLSDPFNKEKYRVLNGTQQTLRIGVSSLSRQLSGIQSERLAFDQQRFDAKAHIEEATNYAQGRFLEHLNQNKDENQAAALAQKETMDKFPGVTPDITKLKNFKSASDYTREIDVNIAKAQQELAASGDQKKAGTIAAKYGVKVSDILPALSNPNKPLVSISQKGETAEAEMVGKKFGEDYANLQKSALTANEQISKLDRMSQLMEGVHTGKLTPAITQLQAIGESFGLKLDSKLPAKQALEALSNEIALQLRNPSGGAGMPGALSDKDREFLTSMTPGLAKTPEGNKLIIDTARTLAKRSQDVAKMARDYRKKNGHFDEGFFDELQAYSDAHPLFAGKEAPVSPSEKPGWSIKPGWSVKPVE